MAAAWFVRAHTHWLTRRPPPPQAYGERCYKSTQVKYLLEAKRLGQKSGAGFYNYKNAKKRAEVRACVLRSSGSGPACASH